MGDRRKRGAKTCPGLAQAALKEAISFVVRRLIAGEKLHEGWRNAAIESRYRQVAEDMNRKVPFLADAITRLDSVEAADMTVTYNYTVLQTPSQPDVERFGADVKQKAVGHYCGPATAFRNDGVAVAMKYVDTSGNALFAFRVTSQDC